MTLAASSYATITSCKDRRHSVGPLSRTSRPAICAGACFANGCNMSIIKVNIKPTSGGEKFQAEIDTSATVRELKEEVARKCDTNADQQRLIYKGQVLKDDRSIESYGTRPFEPAAELVEHVMSDKLPLSDRNTERACTAHG